LFVHILIQHIKHENDETMTCGDLTRQYGGLTLILQRPYTTVRRPYPDTTEALHSTTGPYTELRRTYPGLFLLYVSIRHT